ncbi:hypothetical protein [Mycolicibacterium hodleri]|uniref:hypothetical protein n=1 Tax=Mycolicibacterium hodleri TaxID=49897 RepID=UPI001F3D4548|nr:hypothetical protein [Mycolicibacterium hodleri]
MAVARAAFGGAVTTVAAGFTVPAAVEELVTRGDVSGVDVAGGVFLNFVFLAGAGGVVAVASGCGLGLVVNFNVNFNFGLGLGDGFGVAVLPTDEPVLVWALTTAPSVTVPSVSPDSADLSFDAVDLDSAASSVAAVGVELAELEGDDVVEISSAAATP